MSVLVQLTVYNATQVAKSMILDTLASMPPSASDVGGTIRIPLAAGASYTVTQPYGGAVVAVYNQQPSTIEYVQGSIQSVYATSTPITVPSTTAPSISTVFMNGTTQLASIPGTASPVVFPVAGTSIQFTNSGTVATEIVVTLS